MIQTTIHTEAFGLESVFQNKTKLPILCRDRDAIVIHVFTVILAVLLFTTGCGRKESHDLSAVEKIVCSEPKAALDSLRRIDYKTLSEPDRHYYDFLLIKASDKAYVRHTSDSLILDVIEYYKSHNDRNLYPEVLYYGGRVYSDIGDYPTALRYFQHALDKYPDGSTDLVRSNILSQTGGLLQEMGLCSEAIPYLKETIRINMSLRDTVNLVYNHQLLGSMYMANKMYDLAETHYQQAYDLAKKVSKELMANQLIDMADVKMEKGKLDSAINLIRGVEERVEPEFRNLALVTAAMIYKNAGMPDSAYIFARELVERKDTNNHRLGYKILLSPEVRKFASVDSLVSYSVKLGEIVSEYHDRHERQQFIMQNARYNYMVQQRERHKAERKADRLAIIVLAMALAAAVVIFYLYARWQKHRMELMQARDSIANLEERIREMEKCEEVKLEKSRFDKIKSNDERRNLLRERLLALYGKVNKPVAVSESLYGSEVYNRLMDRVNVGKHIPESDPIWEEVGKTVLEERPDFRHDLEVLSGGKLGVNDWHVALLIRCGVTPTQMTKVFSRSKSTVSHYRRKLLSLVLSPVKNKDRDGHNPSDDELNPSVDDHNTNDDDYSTSVDDIIRLL